MLAGTAGRQVVLKIIECVFLEAPDMYSAVHGASSLYYMKALRLSSKHQYGINKLYYTHMHTKPLFSKLIPEQEIKLSVYACKTEAILTLF